MLEPRHGLAYQQVWPISIGWGHGGRPALDSEVDGHIGPGTDAMGFVGVGSSKPKLTQPSDFDASQAFMMPSGQEKYSKDPNES